MEQENNVQSAEKPRGRPITKENAKDMALSAARAKKLRKEARAKMLAALTEKMDLGEELFKAMRQHDEQYLNMIEKATRLCGLRHEDSPDAVAQKLEVKADQNISGKLEVTVEGL